MAASQVWLSINVGSTSSWGRLTLQIPYVRWHTNSVPALHFIEMTNDSTKLAGDVEGDNAVCCARYGFTVATDLTCTTFLLN